MTPQLHVPFRAVVLGFSLFVGGQAAWQLAAELTRVGIPTVPTFAAASEATLHREHAKWVARFGFVRGDLWAESAFTYADLLWFTTTLNAEERRSLDEARASAERALSYAPHSSAVWLLLAGLNSRFDGSRADAAMALKMSYYTGPSDPWLLALRLSISTHAIALSDEEIQQFVRRDLQLITRRPELKPAIFAAYRDASPYGKRYMEQVLSESDPAFAQSLRVGIPDP
jgi:predicted nucleic acid-binding protein